MISGELVNAIEARSVEIKLSTASIVIKLKVIIIEFGLAIV